MITREEYETIARHIDIVKQIIIDRAISNVSISYREDVLEKIGKKYGWYTCNCGAGIFNATSRIYNAYLEYCRYLCSSMVDKNKIADDNKAANKRARKSNKGK